MAGLEIIFSDKFKTSPDWQKIPIRRKTGWLRERYWAHRVENISDAGFASANMEWPIDREELGRRHDEPGDLFSYWTCLSRMETGGTIVRGNKWVEVTEVFTTTEAQHIERIMRVHHGLQSGAANEVEDFVKHLYKGRPTISEQISATDYVVNAINKKIGKKSYRELPQRYGYGTLVVGLPLWFACPPTNLFRIENVLDNFPVRIACALRELARNELKEKACPFDEVIVVWDVTMTALGDWWHEASTHFSNLGGHTITNPFTIGEILEIVVESNIGNDLMGMDLYVQCRANKPKPRKQIVFSIQKTIDSVLENRDPSENRTKLARIQAMISSQLRWARLRWNVFKLLNLVRRRSKFRTVMALIKLFFVSRWIAWQQRQLYRQSLEGATDCACRD